MKTALLTMLITMSFYISGMASDSPKFIDLSKYANHNGESLTKNYSNLPINEILYSLRNNTPFKITKNSDENIFIVPQSNSDLPYSVEIDFQDWATSVHFFGHIHYGKPNNEILGKYVIRFTDLSVAEILLDSDESSENWNIDDHCCNWRQKDLPKASLAWEDVSQAEKRALIREFVWQNPNPDKKIKSIEFISSGTSVSPVLCAITYIPIYDCAISDSDGDGVIDRWDECSDTKAGSAVYSNGCSSVRGDFNNDGSLSLEDSVGILQILTGLRND